MNNWNNWLESSSTIETSDQQLAVAANVDVVDVNVNVVAAASNFCLTPAHKRLKRAGNFFHWKIAPIWRTVWPDVSIKNNKFYKSFHCSVARCFNWKIKNPKFTITVWPDVSIKNNNFSKSFHNSLTLKGMILKKPKMWTTILATSAGNFVPKTLQIKSNLGTLFALPNWLVVSSNMCLITTGPDFVKLVANHLKTEQS